MSEVRTLSAEQRAVVDHDASSFTVIASAGAGKTFVLVERYLRHVVEEGWSPDQLLTITFTKKAAAEMKERIVQGLRNAGKEREAQIAETGPIQTIHSFCERLLRENALEAALDPNFEILSDSQSARLTIAAVREALASPLDEEPLAEPLIAYLTGHSRQGENRSPYASLESAVLSVLRELRGSGIDQHQIRSWHTDATTLRARWEDAILSHIGEISSETFAAFPATDGGSFHDRLTKAFKASGQRMPEWLRKRPEPEAEREALDQTCGLVQLACAAWWRVERRMMEDQTLDFTALEERAVRLLTQSAVTLERLRKQFAVVMVDEAQDLNPVQYRLLERLSASREMLVGDGQQSIYGFRQADVAHFRRRAESAPSLRLSRNYRSAPGILNFVDHLFGRIWSEGYVPMAPQPAAMDFESDQPRSFEGVEIWRQAAKDADATASYIAELLTEGIRAQDITVLVRDGQGAQTIETGLRGVGIPCRIAGGSERFYTRLEVRDLANALRAVADPYDDFSLLACLRSPVVGLSMDAIVLLGRGSPVVEQLADFASPVPEDGPKLAAFLRWYEPLRKVADRLAAWEVLAEIFAKSAFLDGLARRENPERLLANVRKLLSLATQEPELGPVDYAERIREIQDLRHKEGDAPADEADAEVVTIMTIHKSKGLEFPVVVLPQTDVKLTRSADNLVIEPRFGLVATNYGATPYLMHHFLAHRKRTREEAEEIRVLYVALTRAKERVCVCCYPPRNYMTVSKLVQEKLGDPIPPSIRVREQSEPT